MHPTPNPIKAPPPVQVRRAYVEGPFGQIHLRLASPPAAPTAPPLYCLHQSPKSGLEFEAFMAAAGEDRIVVAPDYPGYGQSDPPPEAAAATIEAYAHSMWAAADALGHQVIDLFGNHTGGMVAAAMAEQAPQRVRAIAMVSAAVLTPEERAAFEAYFQPVPLDRAGTRFSTMWARIAQHAGPGMTLPMMAASLLQNLMGGEGYEWGHAAAFANTDAFQARLGALAHPILALNPADELHEHTKRAAALLHNGVVLPAPAWGHGFLTIHAQAVARLVTRFADAGLVDDPSGRGSDTSPA